MTISRPTFTGRTPPSSPPAPCPRIRVQGDRFIDEHGREVLLRGVNVGGDCKLPWPTGGTHHYSDFSDHREVSFIGRPFPLEEADEHFGRLRHWGFNCIRLLTTWEAVEHAGPKTYDTAYLEYFAEICRRAGDYGLYVFVDFHQDVWSRMSGGDGAPGWTFEAVGLDFTKFGPAGAAHVMQYAYDYGSQVAQQAAYPQMSWGLNYRLPANAIMWTLFWGGRWVAPDFRIEGLNVQDYLQHHYLGAMDQMARRLHAHPNVLGFDTLNEPGIGWIGERLTYRHVHPTKQNPLLPRPGPVLSALDALAIAHGIPTEVPVVSVDLSRRAVATTGATLLNPRGISIWRSGAACPFEQAGAYRVRDGRADCVNDSHFCGTGTRLQTVAEVGFGPFYGEVARTVRAHRSDWSVFAEMDPWGVAAGRRFPAGLPPRTVNANHWYDAPLLFSKRFEVTDRADADPGSDMAGRPGPGPGSTVAGHDPIRERYVRELGQVAARARELGLAPTLIGEFGVPFDLNDGAAYRDWAQGSRDAGIWAAQTTALSLMYEALDELLLHATLWNYTASNRNDLRIGDGWNQEDLSIFSRDQQDDPTRIDSGGRAIGGFCRPCARFVQGTLVAMKFEAEEGRFTLEFDADPAIEGATEIYIPAWHFPHGYEVQAPESLHEFGFSASTQLLTMGCTRSGIARVTITRRQPAA
ncbi:MAG TPA: cellulase family glycosylhydrolase [Steroidobacteraceae bacterium]